MSEFNVGFLNLRTVLVLCSSQFILLHKDKRAFGRGKNGLQDLPDMMAL